MCRGRFGLAMVDGLCPPRPLGQGVSGSGRPLDQLPKVLLTFPAAQIPAGTGGHGWQEQTSGPSCREWESLFLGYKCGGIR